MLDFQRHGDAQKYTDNQQEILHVTVSMTNCNLITFSYIL